MKPFLTILLALSIDLIWGDPPNRFHPVVLMGRWLNWGRQLAPSRHRFGFGALWTLLGAALFSLPWRLFQPTPRLKGMKLSPPGPPQFKGGQGPRLSRLADILPPPSLPLLGGGANTSPPAGGTEGGRIAANPGCPPLNPPQGGDRRQIPPAGGLGGPASVTNLMTLPPRLPIVNYQWSIINCLLSIMALKSIFAYRNLRRSVLAVGQALAEDDLVEARRLTSWHLVSRDTSQLTAEEVAGAAIESLAENLTDSVTAPLMAYAVGGLPAAWAYRLINTTDAMWGYRTPEFEQLGKFPAKLDDALNWLPARLTGWALVGATWLTGPNGPRAAQVMLDQHSRTASPNAGWTMSAMAGALGVTLTKRDVYTLAGGSNRLDVAAVRRAVRLADTCVGIVVAGLGIGLVIGGIGNSRERTNR